MLEQLERSLDGIPDLAWNLILVGLSVLIALAVKLLLAFLLRFYSKSTDYSLVGSILKRMSGPVNFFLPLFVLNLFLPAMRLKHRFYIKVDKTVEILLTVAFAAILIGIIKVLEDNVYHRYDLSKTNNLRERKVRTQLQFVRKLAISIIIILTACIILLSFESLRKIGAGLLTGVGLGGIIIGFAAQKSLANLLAGFQIAFTQPLRIDDVLVVEGEWGRVEEITLTYVVLNIWDQRRLILPINYFIEKPFQNWTRTGSELLGTAFFFLDYTTPIEPLREELTRLLTAHPLWDKRVNALQVTNITERTIEVRALMSANTSGQAFDLRCYIREQLLVFIRENYPDCLPKNRASVDGPPAGDAERLSLPKGVPGIL